MGQSASSPAPQAGSAEAQPRRQSSAFWRRTTSEHSGNGHISQERPRTSRPRPASVNRLSQMLSPTSSSYEADDTQRSPTQSPRRSSLATRLQRSRNSLIFGAPSTLFPRRGTSNQEETPSNTRSLWPESVESPPHFTTPSQRSTPDLTLPDVEVPDLDIDFTQGTSASATGPAVQRPPTRRSSIRLPNSLSDRLAGLRPNRNQSASNAVLRRRRSPASAIGEDNTVLLSRLLSVAAATTAATLLEGSGETMENARGFATDGDDGSFEGFLQSLESGRLAAALRAPTQPVNGMTPSGQTQLNFFRMFRFSAQPARNNQNQRGNPDNNHRMVPIIIVGIRAVPPGAHVHSGDEAGVPPFLDALSALPTTPFNANSFGSDLQETLRGPQNGTRFSAARRRASMGGLSRFPLGYDNQRHHRSPERHRPMSVASELASWPRPPPATPASPNLSNVNSTETTPAPTVPGSRRSSYSGTARRESIIRTTTTTTLETTTEDVPVRSRPVRQRRASETEHRNSFPSRRNGYVEPDNTPLPENTRSWIIYVLGGSYPENHPILTTPSLFTDSPTYEDMMLLSTLLGPAKPPVASESDVASAGGVYKIDLDLNDAGEKCLVATAVESNDRIELVPDQRCLVCLCDMEKGEEARKLAECGHLYHRECIDEWLTKGRNSCPLCRGQGVQEKEKKPEAPPVDSATSSPVIPSEPESATAA